MNIIPENIFIFIVFASIIFLAAWIRTIHVRIKKLSTGSDGKNLENHLAESLGAVTGAREDYEEIKSYVIKLSELFEGSIQHTSLIRYNPYDDAGGKNSFSLALLNNHGNGVVLTSLYSRERTNIFSKKINEFKSEQPLTKEETEAIAVAKSN